MSLHSYEMKPLAVGFSEGRPLIVLVWGNLTLFVVVTVLCRSRHGAVFELLSS